MLNQIVLVGRLTSNPAVVKEENKTVSITLAVPRSYKNADGEYETDFIPCLLWNSVGETTLEYLKQGDLIGIKGRAQSVEVDGKIEIQIVAERVTFLSQKKED